MCPADIKKGKRRPKIGDVVTFRYTWRNQQNEIVRRAQIIKIRDDVLWSHSNISPNEKKVIPCKYSSIFYLLNYLHNPIDIFSRVISEPPIRNTPGYWTRDGGENIKNIFIEFAKSHLFDPLVAENWYKITGKYFFDFMVLLTTPFILLLLPNI